MTHLRHRPGRNPAAQQSPVCYSFQFGSTGDIKADWLGFFPDVIGMREHFAFGHLFRLLHEHGPEGGLQTFWHGQGRRNRALSFAVGTLLALLIAVGMFILLVSQQ